MTTPTPSSKREKRVASPPGDGATDSPSGTWQGHPLCGSLGPHAADWDALNQSQFNHHPLLTSHFWNGLLQHYGQPGLVLWVLRDGMAVRAMCLLQYKQLGHWVNFLPPATQLGPTMIRDLATAHSLLRSLRPRAVQLDLLCVDPDVWPQTVQSGALSMTHLHALTMAVDASGSFDCYWGQRPSGLRQNMRRYQRRVELEPGQLQLRHVTDPTEMPAAVNRYAALESRGWKGVEGTALTLGNEQAQFYRDLLAGSACGSVAIVHELWHHDQLVASRLALQSHGMRVMLKTTYDESFAHMAPGQMLLKAALQQAFEDPGVRRVEFFTNASVDQLSWADQSRWIRHLSLGAQTPAGAAWRGLQSMRQVMASRRGTRADDSIQVSSLGMDEAWPSDVTRLLDDAAKTTPEASSAWFQNLWQQVFQGRAQGRLWVLRSATHVLAVLPVLVEGKLIGKRLGALSNYYTALFVPALAKHTTPRQLAYLLRQLRAHHAPLGQIRLEPLDPCADTTQQLQMALQLAGFICLRYFRFNNWHLPSPGSYALYLKGRTANLRSTIKRKTRGLAEAGGEIEIVTGADHLARAMAAYWTVYRASWKQDEPYPQFVDGLAAWAAGSGALRLGIVWLNGLPIAAQLWLVSAGRAEIFKVAYDETHKDMSPGTVLTAALIEQVLDRDAVTEVDFLIGDDAYKRYWMSHCRERWGLVGFNPVSLSGLAGLLRMLIGRLARRLQRSAQPGASA